MTDETAAEDPATGEEAEEEGAGEPKPTGKMPGKKLILFIALPVLLLIPPMQETCQVVHSALNRRFHEYAGSIAGREWHFGDLGTACPAFFAG